MRDYSEKLAAMDDEALVDEVASKVWLSSFAANNPRSKYHAQCDATYEECTRRKKPWLYQRGWNRTWVGEGHPLSDRDRAAASPDYYAEQQP